MTNHASRIKRDAPLSSDFARSFVERRYGSEGAALIYSLLPKFSRGPRKGLVKGYVRWIKTERGGWVGKGSDGSQALGHVAVPGVSEVQIVLGREDTYGIGDRGDHAVCSDADWLAIVRFGMENVFQQGRVAA